MTTYTTGDVQNLLPQVEAGYSALNGAIASSTGMQPSDVTAWAGVYAGFEAYDAQVRGSYLYGPSLAGLLNPFGAITQDEAVGDASTVYDKLLGYQATLGQWQQTLAAADSAYKPPPAPTTPVVLPDTKTWPSWVKWSLGVGAIVGGLFGLDKVAEIYNDWSKS